MESGTQDQDRALAYQKFILAQQEVDKGHLDRAEDCAKEALEFDGKYHEVRLWLADLYLAQAEDYKASRVLQDVLYQDRGNDDAWAKLKTVDPQSAARLERLGSIAPDPFVGAHRAEFDDDFEELGSEGAAEGETSGWGVNYDSAAAEVLEEFTSGEDDGADPEEEAEVWDVDETESAPAATSATPEPAPAAGAAPEKSDGRGSAPWEYEQDRDYLARWRAQEIVAQMVAVLHQMWIEAVKLAPAYQHCAHMERSRHPEIAAEAEKCLHKLGMQDCEWMMVAERSLYPVPMQDGPPKVAIPTGLIRGMAGPELEFHLGRMLEYIRAGYLAELQVGDLLLDRNIRLVGDETNQAVRDVLGDLLAEFLSKVRRDDRERLIKLAHAWQQRATLSADRAGWLCCGDLDRACLAIAKGTARSLDEAAKMTLGGFLEQFKGQDPAKLAAIPPKEWPDRNPGYGAYRIQMLRWWAKRPEAVALRDKFAD